MADGDGEKELHEAFDPVIEELENSGKEIDKLLAGDLRQLVEDQIRTTNEFLALRKRSEELVRRSAENSHELRSLIAYMRNRTDN